MLLLLLHQLIKYTNTAISVWKYTGDPHSAAYISNIYI